MTERSKTQLAQYVREMEHVLRWDGDPALRAGIVAVLQRWQVDGMLDETSREKVRALIREFAPRATG